MKQSNKKTPVVFYLSFVLLCAVLITTHMMSGLYARYTAQAGGGDEARVATFSFEDNLSAQAQVLPTTFSPGESLPITIKIKNTGEVTLRYVVKIENLTKNLPIEEQTINSSEVACNGESEFSWNIEWPKSKNSVEYMGKMDVLRIVVTVEQVD